MAPWALQAPKYFSMAARALSRRDLADDDDGRQVGPEHARVVAAHVGGVSARTRFRVWRGAASGRPSGNSAARSERWREEAGAGVARGDAWRQLAADDLQRRLRQGRVQLIVRQQLHGRVEVLAERLHGEIRAGPLARADGIERLLEGDPVEVFAAVGEQPLQQLAHALLALRAPASPARLRM